ncbi:hypothetical protein DRI50_07455 [candidate division KSB1 bacterium]|nr:MAG: hypothetical protein DRI50_07455 [candidate division KSB1 bacterium]
MRRFYIKVLFLLTALLLSACSPDAPTAPAFDYEPEINVFGLFILNRQQKTIRIERTYKVDEYFPDFRGVEDADVWVSTKDQNVHFEHLFNGNYSDKQNQLLLAAGEIYRLKITMADGRKVAAECTMPAPPRILSPAADEAVTAFHTLDVFWERGEYAHRYQVAVDDEFRNFKTSNFSDSTYSQLYPFIFAHTGRYTLKVASLDQNYYDHLRSRSGREPILHIQGAIGVFGAIAYDQSIFYAY